MMEIVKLMRDSIRLRVWELLAIVAVSELFMFAAKTGGGNWWWLVAGPFIIAAVVAVTLAYFRGRGGL